MIILIPAYEPDEKLISLVKQIINYTLFDIVVVNDGSGSIYEGIFHEVEELGCTVLAHQANRGKGCALKTGFQYILDKTCEAQGVVTADADGQHILRDIISVAERVPSSPDCIILGERKFIGKVPLKSTIGNSATRLVFSLASRQKVFDTQTGLRGFPVSILPWLLTIGGDRYEYEMNMLLKASSGNIQIKRVNISTVYLEGNKSSHFHPLRDSILVYLPILKFCISSLCGAAIDYFSLFVIVWLTDNLFTAVVGARILSSAANFIINRFFVFAHTASREKTFNTAIKYYSLVCIILICNYLLLRFLSEFCGIHLFWSKILTEIILFVFSYAIQHLFIFKNKNSIAIP